MATETGMLPVEYGEPVMAVALLNTERVFEVPLAR